MLRLHAEHAGEFIWPRTAAEFEAMAEDRQVFAAFLGKQVVAVCYIRRDEEHAPPRWEFGGVYVHEQWRGYGSPPRSGTSPSGRSGSMKSPETPVRR